MPLVGHQNILEQFIRPFGELVLDFIKQFEPGCTKYIGYILIFVLGSAVVIIW